MVIDSLNHEGTGDFTNSKLDLTTKSTAKVSLDMDKMNYMKNVKLTLGTDSLASNHQLSILSEMQTLQDHKNVPFEELLKWATLNGAEFLSIDDQYGSFEVGKKPGINLIGLNPHFALIDQKVQRII